MRSLSARRLRYFLTYWSTLRPAGVSMKGNSGLSKSPISVSWSIVDTTNKSKPPALPSLLNSRKSRPFHIRTFRTAIDYEKLDYSRMLSTEFCASQNQNFSSGLQSNPLVLHFGNAWKCGTRASRSRICCRKIAILERSHHVRVWSSWVDGKRIDPAWGGDEANHPMYRHSIELVVVCSPKRPSLVARFSVKLSMSTMPATVFFPDVPKITYQPNAAPDNNALVFRWYNPGTYVRTLRSNSRNDGFG